MEPIVIKGLYEYGYPRRLNMSQNFKVQDDILKFVAETSGALEDINLHQCNNITNSGLQALAEQCNKVKNINLSECVNITDAGIKGLSEGCSEIEVQRCNLHDVSLIFIIDYQP